MTCMEGFHGGGDNPTMRYPTWKWRQLAEAHTQDPGCKYASTKGQVDHDIC